MTTFLMVCLGILMLSASLMCGGIGFWLGMKGFHLFWNEVDRSSMRRSATKKEGDNDEA